MERSPEFMCRRLSHLILASAGGWLAMSWGLGVSPANHALLAAEESAALDTAATPGTSAAAMFHDLDRSGDGQLTRDEVPDDKRTLFARLLQTADRDGNGSLSREEFSAGLESAPRRPLEEPVPDAGERPGRSGKNIRPARCQRGRPDRCRRSSGRSSRNVREGPGSRRQGRRWKTQQAGIDRRAEVDKRPPAGQVPGGQLSDPSRPRSSTTSTKTRTAS